MNQLRASFGEELVKLAATPPKEKKRSLLGKAVTLGLGGAAAYGAYRYGRKVRLSKDPLLRQMQSKSKGKLTHVDILDDGGVPATGLKKKLHEARRGVDEIIAEPYDTFIKRHEKVIAGEPVEKVRHVEGALHAMGRPSQHKGYSSDNPLAHGIKRVTDLGENKMLEAEYFKNVPGMAKSESAAKYVKKAPGGDPATQLDELQATLSKKYPNGYVVKPIEGAASGGVPTHNARFADILAGKGNKAHKEWMEEMLEDPSDYMVQEYIPIAKSMATFAKPPLATGQAARKIQLHKQVPDEFRVHVFGGKVVRGASSHRWAAGQELYKRKQFRELDQFVQDAVNKLPDKGVGTPMAFDVVKDTKGKWRIIEANVGGESGFLAPEASGASVRAPQAVYKAVTGRSSKPEAAVKGVAAGGATIAGSNILSSGGEA